MLKTLSFANTGSDAVSRNFIMLLVVHNGDGGRQVQQSQSRPVRG